MGDTKQTAVTESGARREPAAATRRVVVAGDVTLDWNLARTRKLADAGVAWNAADRTEAYFQPGGAALQAGLAAEVAATLAADGISVEVSGPSVPAGRISPADPRFNHSYALWSRYPRRKGDPDSSIWRVQDFLGLDRARNPEAAPAASDRVADLVLLDDADLGFRSSPASWPTLLGLDGDARPAVEPWVLLKMACPVASGELWRRLLRLHAGRLIVVMTLDDLRFSDVTAGLPGGSFLPPRRPIARNDRGHEHPPRQEPLRALRAARGGSAGRARRRPRVPGHRRALPSGG